MAHRLLRDPDADGWERADFPIVCETCLGPNPYVRMQRMEFGGECHISGRPYTKFRWRPGNDARYKGTIICQEVAKAKNVCQVCLLDLDYNLPVQVRDQALGMADEALPESDVGKEFALERMANEGQLGAAFDGPRAKANETILKLQRTTPYYQRNRAPICSFFVKGECKRGAECPYRHEMPTTGDLAKQNIKDRYFGVNDPVARKMLGRVDNLPKLVPPDDTTITTLFVGNLQPGITEDDLSDAFSLHGEISRIKIVEARGCAFVTYRERADAETAADQLQNKLIVKGIRLKLMWGRPQERREDTSGAAPLDGSVPAGMVPPHVQRQMGGGVPFAPPGANFFGLGPPGGPAAYPSMDPQQAGTRVRSRTRPQARYATAWQPANAAAQGPSAGRAAPKATRRGRRGPGRETAAWRHAGAGAAVRRPPAGIRPDGLPAERCSDAGLPAPAWHVRSAARRSHGAATRLAAPSGRGCCKATA